MHSWTVDSEVFQDVVPSQAEALSRHKVFEHFHSMLQHFGLWNSCYAIWTCSKERTATLAQTLAALLTLAWHKLLSGPSQCQQGSQSSRQQGGFLQQKDAMYHSAGETCLGSSMTAMSHRSAIP